MPNAAIYTRVSTDEQAKTGLSLESQETACTKFAAANGYEVTAVFREEGASAKTAKRPQLIAMLDFLGNKKNKVDAVVVWKLDRFARNAEDHLMLRALINKSGARLISVTEPIEDTITGRLMETVLAGFAQFDNEVRTERSTSGLRARREQGGWVTYAPLGYENIKDSLGRPTLQVKPDIASKIVQLFKQYATGSYTQDQITQYAYELGLRSRQTGGRLSTQTVVNILGNAAYTGKIFDKEAGEAKPALHEAIINDGLFQEVQAVLKGKGKPFRHSRDIDWPLRSGFVLCADCGTPLTGSRPKGRNKYYAKYSCPKCRTSVTGKPVSIDREALHNSFTSLLENVRPKPKHLKLFRQITLKRWNLEYKEVTTEKARVEEDLSKLQTKRQRVLDLYVDGKLSEQDKNDQLKKIDNDRSVLMIRRGELESDVVNRELVIDAAIDFMSNAASYWARAPLELQRRFQYLVFPAGISYDFVNGFGTAQMGSSYEAVKALTTKNSSVVGVPKYVCSDSVITSIRRFGNYSVKPTRKSYKPVARPI